MLKKQLLEIMRCPACKGDIYEKDERIICPGCGRRYSIIDGVPVMLVDEAEQGPPEQTEESY